MLTATFMKYALPYGWDWNLSLVFGAMVAATDPVAVVALLEELVGADAIVPLSVMIGQSGREALLGVLTAIDDPTSKMPVLFLTKKFPRKFPNADGPNTAFSSMNARKN